MKTLNLDRNFFLQIGLDSGSLTMHGSVLHSLREPGEYRGTVRRSDTPEATFYITADQNSAVAHVNIDLAALVEGGGIKEDCCKDEARNRFVVNPKGYVLLHVGGGAGGYYAHIRKAAEDPKTKVWDSRNLEETDIFAGMLLRPGTYSVENVHVKGASGRIIVSYPVIYEKAYHPAKPVTLEFNSRGISPPEVKVQPGQGINCQVKVPTRVKIALVHPDDGPMERREPAKPGWQKYRLPSTSRNE
jgi:hypothetical protein